MRWRRAFVAVHRDLGYFFAGLTVLYAISGVAVNHTADWNPSYRLERTRHQVGEIPTGSAAEQGREVARRMGIAEEPVSAVKVGPELLKVFFDNRTLTVSLPGGEVEDEHRARRFFLYEVNFLHLNKGKGWWTWFADIYAIGLAVLAFTGMFIITGRKGLAGRGKWLVGAGLLAPLLYLIFSR
ncbi:MAG: PepSY-associated TM helix domain-containing protein [Acidobacteriota bacterium]